MVLLSWVDDVAVVTIDNPPINASTHSVRSGLIEVLGSIAAEGRAVGIVLIGASATFVAGSDIKEFGAPIADPQLPQVLDAIVASPIPVAAAIDGFALGGGLELALACDIRVATPTATVGLPEVTLGLVPGAGGTQRLPRLIGIASAIELAATGKRIKASAAHKLGLVEVISEGDLLQDAIVALRQLSGKKRLSEGPITGSDPEAVAASIRVARSASKGRPAGSKTIDLVLKSAEMSLTDGLKLERETFNAIRVQPEAFAYRHLFFAERKAGKFATPSDVSAISKVAVIGAGTMGAAIAYSLAGAGYTVTLIDNQNEALARADQRLADIRANDVRAGRVTADRADAAAQRLSTSTDMAAASTVDLVIEAVFEDIDVKKAVMAKLASVVSDTTVIATNTSYLDIEKITADVPNGERVLGLHFFAPANLMKLVEVIRIARTNDDTTARVLAVAKRLGKQPVIAGNAFGFIGNRIYAAYRKHAEFLILDGASPSEVDAAMTEFGMAMGPFAVADLSGLDIAYRMRQSRKHLRHPDERYVDIADRLCEMQRLGRKTGGGYYDYPASAPEHSSAVAEVIAQARSEAGIAPRSIDRVEIVSRCVGAMANEAAHVLAEGVAQRPSDIDVVMVHGFGFPRWQGGITWWANAMQPQQLNSLVDMVASAEGSTFRRADLSNLSSEA